MRFILTTAVVTITICGGQSRASVLAPGDIALIGYGSSTAGALRTDTVRFLALATLPADQAIFFTDEELPLGAFEGRLRYTPAHTLATGTVIEIRFDSAQNTGVATLGTITETDPGFDLSAQGDGLIAYQGTSSTPTTFLSALNYSSDPLGDLTGHGLAFGLNAIDVSSLSPRRKAEYRGPRQFANAPTARAAIYDIQHWVGGDDTFSFQVPTGRAVFTFGTPPWHPVPEPTSWLLWSLLGMTSCGMAKRHRTVRHRKAQRPLSDTTGQLRPSHAGPSGSMK